MSPVSCVDVILANMPAEFEGRGEPVHNPAMKT